MGLAFPGRGRFVRAPLIVSSISAGVSCRLRFAGWVVAYWVVAYWVVAVWGVAVWGVAGWVVAVWGVAVMENLFNKIVLTSFFDKTPICTRLVNSVTDTP